MHQDVFHVIMRAKMNDGCKFEATSWGIIMITHAPRFPKLIIEIDHARTRAVKTQKHVDPFEDVPILGE